LIHKKTLERDLYLLKECQNTGELSSVLSRCLYHDAVFFPLLHFYRFHILPSRRYVAFVSVEKKQGKP